jgi:hypothetical protein
MRAAVSMTLESLVILSVAKDLCTLLCRWERTRPSSPTSPKVKAPGDKADHQKEFQTTVREVWAKRNRQWLVRTYSCTRMKGGGLLVILEFQVVPHGRGRPRLRWLLVS